MAKSSRFSSDGTPFKTEAELSKERPAFLLPVHRLIFPLRSDNLLSENTLLALTARLREMLTMEDNVNE
ncbi:MAG: hypothetical protein RR998_05285 [Oscillospiraceae bacterium]